MHNLLHLLTATNTVYIGVDSDKTWSDAQEHCESTYNGALAKILNEEQNRMVRIAAIDVGISDNVWIGATDSANEGTWLWTDDTEVNYTNWADGEPNNSGNNEDCGGQYSNEEWNDAPCSYSYPFVCYYSTACM